MSFTGKHQFDEGSRPASPAGANWPNLLQQQSECFEAIRALKSNFKKDGPSRRTAEYLKKRLNTLEGLWVEFVANDDLLKQMENKESEYFVDDIFNKTKVTYEALKQEIMTSNLALSLGMRTTPKKMDGNVPSQRGTLTEIVQKEASAASGSSEVLTEESRTTLRQQLLNFNALERAISKIDLVKMDEKWELEDSLNTLKARWNAIDKLHWELNFVLGENLPVYGKEYSKWENAYDTLKKIISKKIWASAHYKESTPRMELPEFDGNYSKWVSFKDLFIETVHSNPLLSKSQKMQHLKAKLKGDAEKLIQHLAISAENYDSCWEIIQHRYENKRLLFSSYINTLLGLNMIQQPSAFNIKKMHDTIKECVNGLTNLGLDISTWDPLLVHLLLPKLDTTTYNEYAHDMKNPRELPALQELIDFLEGKFIAFESMKHNQQNHNSHKPENLPKNQGNWYQKPTLKSFNFQNKFHEPRATTFKKPEKWTKSHYTTFKSCPLCKKGHVLMYCGTFLNMDVATRNESVAKLQVCRNCLFSHNGKECVSNKNCKRCDKAHHTLLHNANMENIKGHQQQANQQPSTSTQRSAHHVNTDIEEVLLTTVKLMVVNIEGMHVTLRALLDQGSQVSLISENAAQRLRLPRRKLSAVVSGVGSSEGNSKGCLSIECKSIHSDFTFTTEVLIMKKLVNNLPSTTLKNAKWDHLENLKLADPDFNISGPIDILLGADVYSQIIVDGVLKRDTDAPVAQQTKLGWIICGNVKRFNCLVVVNELQNLTRFWETEEISCSNESTDSDDYCERHYAQTTELQHG